MAVVIPSDDPSYASAAAVAGLAREVEGLRRTVEPLRDAVERTDELARLVAQLADAVSALPARPAPTAPPSWLVLPADTGAAGHVLGELLAWLHAVYLRYADGAAVLPECWPWHPEVVEELLWLMHAWLAAYQGKHASVAAAGDWHDRARPGVVRRIRSAVGTCSLENHLDRDGWGQPMHRGPRLVPGAQAADLIAAWWGEHRDEPAPEPTPGHVDSAVLTSGRGGRTS